MPVTRSSRYQQGTIDQVKRSKGEDVWVYRWRETAADGSRVQRKKTIGDLSQFPTEKSAWQAIENLRAEINSAKQRVGKTTVADAWGHFQIHELHDPGVGDRLQRSAATWTTSRIRFCRVGGRSASMMSRPSRLSGGCGDLISRTLPRRKSGTT